MPYFGASDGLTFHAKVIKAGNDAVGAWCRAGAWSAHPENLTEGFIPVEVAHLIAPAEVWAKLLSVHLCDAPTGDRQGYQIHDYLDHNPTAAKTRARFAAARERTRRWREANGIPSSRPKTQRHGDAARDGDGDASRTATRPGVPVVPNSSHVRAAGASDPDPEIRKEIRDQKPESTPLPPRGGCDGAAVQDQPPPTKPQGSAPGPIPPPAPKADPAAQRARKPPPAPKPDLDPATLVGVNLDAYNALLADPTLPEITDHPAQTAVDLVRSGPALDVPQQIAAAGAWLRANPAQAKRNGARFLTNWIRRAQERGGQRTATSAAASLPPEASTFLTGRWRAARQRQRRLETACDPDARYLAKFWSKCAEAATRAADGSKPGAWVPTPKHIAAFWIRCYLAEEQSRAGGVKDTGYPFAWLSEGDRASGYGLPKRSDMEQRPTDGPETQRGAAVAATRTPPAPSDRAPPPADVLAAAAKVGRGIAVPGTTVVQRGAQSSAASRPITTAAPTAQEQA